MKRQRKSVLVDQVVQGKLVGRVLVYWSLSMCGTFMVLVGSPYLLTLYFSSSDAISLSQLAAQTWRLFWPVLFASGMVLPFVLMDVLRVSHRFAGPIRRLRGAMQDLADGKRVEPIKFRDDDFWFEMAEEFNRVADRVRDLEPASKPAATADAGTPGSVAL